MNRVQAIRGMNDILPEESPIWHYLESRVGACLTSCGYREIRFPILEKTELFTRSIGAVTDIIEKEMYTFDDRNGDSLSLRPEGTASCVRACEQHGLLYNQIQRLWYLGPMFRHERPQKGRLRQFHQIGVEAFGLQGPDLDAELLLMTARLWRLLDIDEVVRLEINSIGTTASRAVYRQALVDYLTTVKEQLDEDSQRRLDTNPLRILDSKNPDTQALLVDAPKLADYLDRDSREHFSGLKDILDQAGLNYTVNPRLVRGLDYYGYTVFEWVTDKLGAQGTICAGGRYNGLVAQLGGRPTPAAGFAMGMERLVLMLQTLEKIPASVHSSPHVYILAVGEVQARALIVAGQLRDACPNLIVQTHCGGGSVKSQLKKADKSGATWGLVIGPEEVANNTVTLKYLREIRDQQTLPVTEAIDQIATVTRYQ